MPETPNQNQTPPEDELRHAAWILARSLELGDTYEAVIWLAAQLQNVVKGKLVNANE